MSNKLFPSLRGNKVSLYSPVVGTMIGLAILATPVAAQSTDLNNSGAQNSQSQPGTNSISQTDDNQGFDWRWLLPLALIPIILPFLLRKDRTEDEQAIDTRSQVAYHDVDRKRTDENIDDDELI